VIRRTTGRVCLAIIVAGGIALGLSACGSDDNGSGASSDTSGAAAGGGGKIALLLPETQNARYETKDRPLFEAKVKELCPDCEVLYSNADQDAAKQQQQAEAALTNGAKVMVLDAVDAASTGPIIAQAKAKGVPVFAYDREIPGEGVAYYNSYDNAKVGELQANSLIQALGPKADGGTIVMINGAPTDNNAKLFKQGAHSVFDKSKLKIGAEYDTPNWQPSEAQSEMDQAITKLGKNGFVGDYNANDGTAGGAIAAMKAAGINPSTIPSTGQDAELAAIQRILVGEQYMTVYKAIKPQAEDAATIAVELVKGEDVSVATGS
jgi:D-xylose transport system substrate-binding protein